MLRAGVCLDADAGITFTFEDPWQNVVYCGFPDMRCGGVPCLCHWESNLDHKGE